MDKNPKKKKKETNRSLSAEERQKALDDISAEDLAKIQSHQASTQGAYPVDEEWLLLAEFAITFGWQAYLDVKHDKRENVTGAEMLTLLEASRKLKSGNLYDMATASFIGAGSAQSKKPGQTFQSMTKNIIKQTKVDKY